MKIRSRKEMKDQLLKRIEELEKLWRTQEKHNIARANGTRKQIAGIFEAL